MGNQSETNNLKIRIGRPHSFFISSLAALVFFSSAATASVSTALNGFVQEAISPGRELASATYLKDSLKIQFCQDQNPQELHRVHDLIDYILFLKSRVLFFEKNNTMLLVFIESLGEADLMLDGQANRLRNDVAGIFSDSATGDFLIAPVEQLNHIVQILKNLESTLLVQLKKMQIVNDELRSLKIQVALYHRGLNRLHKQEQDLVQYSDMQSMIQGKETIIRRQDQDIKDLKRQIDKLALGMDVFRDRLQAASERIDQLVSDVTASSLDLYQKEMDCSRANNQAQDMAEEFYETKERLFLVQRIIQEKDLHIQTLEKDLSQMQGKIQPLSGDGAVDILRGEMRDAIDDLKLEIARGQEKIQRLENRFQETVLLNAQLESEIVKKNFAISLLEQQAIQNRTFINGLEQSLRVRAEQLVELRGIVKIYQMKLLEYKNIGEEQEGGLKKTHGPRQADYGEAVFSFDDDVSDNEAAFYVPDTILWSPELIGDVSKDALDRFK